MVGNEGGRISGREAALASLDLLFVEVVEVADVSVDQVSTLGLVAVWRRFIGEGTTVDRVEATHDTLSIDHACSD